MKKTICASLVLTALFLCLRVFGAAGGDPLIQVTGAQPRTDIVSGQKVVKYDVAWQTIDTGALTFTGFTVKVEVTLANGNVKTGEKTVDASARQASVRIDTDKPIASGKVTVTGNYTCTFTGVLEKALVTPR